MNRKAVVLIAAIVAVAAVVGGVLLYDRQQETAANQIVEANRAVLIRMHSPTVGRSDAPVVIVEFFDPACETCSTFYPMVKKLMAAHPDRIRLVLRYAPFHRGSDKVVSVLEAARRQGKFWPALEALLSHQDVWTENHTAFVDRAWKPLESVGLNMEQIAFDLTSPDVAAVIAQDLADARTLNVSQTPEYFVNGKPLPSFGFKQLEDLVDQALADTASRKGGG